MAFAAGARDGFVREHVDNCYFCHDIVHGGTEEFPLSFDQEVAEVKAARRRQSRRRFLKLTAAGLAGIALIGGGGLVASKYVVNRRTEKLQLRRFNRLDQIFANQGRPGIERYMLEAGAYERGQLCLWIGDRQYSALVDLLIENLGSSDLGLRSVATSQLALFPPATLSAFKSHLSMCLAAEIDADQVEHLSALIDSIP
ncbi:MAG: twin-arginine translocation signal domain-containing protein [Planctomycetes bacterium]|nr:twin-arginine translocation signal domain-containing protein [Planctomycetota bacterium]